MEQKSEFDDSRIERAKRGIYGQTADESAAPEESLLTPPSVEVSSDWGDVQLNQMHRRKNQISTKLLKFILTCAVLATFASGAYLIYSVWDPFSALTLENIIINPDLPVAVTPGVSEAITVQIVNNNRAPLEYVSLRIIYPPGTRSGKDANKDLRDEPHIFDVIDAQATVNYQTSAIFLGEENASANVEFQLEFRFKGTNSVFTKSEIRPVKMLAAPINLKVNTLKEINGGQSLDLDIDAVSNASIPLNDVIVKIDYPLGFSFASAKPAPTSGNNVWRIGKMEPGGKVSIALSGVLNGIDNEEKVFRTSIGVAGSGGRDIATTYGAVISSVRLIRPFIGIRLEMNGKPMTDAVVPYGERVDSALYWQNNLPTRIVDGQIEVRLRGVGLDRRAVSAAGGGFYRSIDNTIFWDSRGNEDLAVLDAGMSGKVGFGFTPLPPVSNNQVISNPEICADVTVRGRRYDENGVPESINSFTSQCAKVTSKLQFAARSVYYAGPFTNTGPLPPRAEQETTYTVIWSAVNTSNAVTNAKVRAVLPVYMEWARMVSPATEKVTYNQLTHEIVWDIGNLAAGTGIGEKPPREVAFQVIFTPSISQVGTSPNILSQTTFTGTDSFTGTTITQSGQDITTTLSTDPSANVEQSRVVP